MKLLDQFIVQVGKRPADWTSQDVQNYMDYVKKMHVTDEAAPKRYDHRSNVVRIHTGRERRYT
jgi:hypothetical protein